MDKKCLQFAFIFLLVISLFSFLPMIQKVQATTTATEIGTSTVTNALSHSWGRKMFYAENTQLYCIFYSNGSHMIYQTVEGTSASWSSITSVRVCAWGNYFYIWYESRGAVDYIHYVFNNETSGSSVFYRRGTLASNGVITWSAGEQTVYTFTGTDGAPSGVSVDNDGYPFVMWDEQIGGGQRVLSVSKSSTNDGIWNADSGFPYNVTGPYSVTRAGQIIPLNGTQMYAVWVGQNVKVEGRLWTGSSWQSVENVSTLLAYHSSRWSVTSGASLDNTIDVIFQEASTYDIQHVRRTSSWGAETELDDLSTTVIPVITRVGDYLQVWWYRSSIIYAKRYESNSWGATETFYQSGIIYSDSLCSFSVSYSGGLGLAWLYTGDGSPYSLMIAFAYSYTFYGVFDEETGLLKTASERATNITAYFADEQRSVTFTLNETCVFYTSSVPQHFMFNLTNQREYWISPTEINIDIYVFDDSTTTYTIAFLDLAGALDDYPFVSAQCYINGTLHTVEKRKVDEEKKILMNLENGEKYNLVIQDGSSYTFGDVLMTSVTTVQLTLKGIEFPKETLLTYNYVRIYGTRAFGTPNGNITITYEDTLEQTTSVDIYINYKNGTNAYNATETADSFVHTWTSAVNSTDYRVECNVDHERYGTYTWKQYFPREFSEVPWGLGFLGSLPFDTSIIIPTFLILFVGGCFSVINAETGAFMAVVTSAVLTYLGWIDIAPGLLTTAMFLAIMMAIIYAKRSVVT